MCLQWLSIISSQGDTSELLIISKVPPDQLHTLPNGPNLFTQLFQLLGEIWSSYNGIWFLGHHFGYRSSGKLKFGLSTHMTF